MRVSRYDRMLGRRRLSPLAVVCIILAAVLSLGGAYLWQRADYASSGGPGFSLPVFSRGQERLPDPPTNLNVSSYPQQTTQAAEEIATAALTYDPQPEPEPGYRFAPGTFAVPWQINAGEPVDRSYFDDAIFFGDSLLSVFSAHRVFRDTTGVIAVIGATPVAANTMLEAASESGEWGKVYIMLGSQGLHLDDQEFIEGYRQFVAEVRSQWPGASVYIMSMPPVARHVGQHHPGVTRQRITELNAAIAELARATQGTHFLNVFDAFADPDGYLPAHASTDGLHLTAEYTFLLLDFLKTHTSA